LGNVGQNKKTGEIQEIGDLRYGSCESDWETVVDFTWFYPHNWERPYAAYLLPKDLEVGERVWIEDLIEDLVGGKWNQGDEWRLNGCEAVWDGTNLVADYSEENIDRILG